MTQTKLPEYWAIQINEDKRIQIDHPLLQKFKDWYSSKFSINEDFDSLFYGAMDYGTEEEREEIYNETSGKYDIITLEQWNEAVNGKDANICDTCKEPLFLEPSHCHKCGIEEKQPRLKVGDKIPLYLSGKLNYGGLDGKIVDKIYFEFTEDQDIKVTNKNKELYWVSNYKNTYCMLISEVDAIIEEQEREMKEPSIFSLNERIHQAQDEVIKKYEQETKQPIDSFSKSVTEAMMNPYFAAPFKDYMNPLKDKEEWIPKNGEEVEVATQTETWHCGYKFVGIDSKCHFVVERTASDGKNVFSSWERCRKNETVTKTHSEIAELLGISKEQLKIVED